MAARTLINVPQKAKRGEVIQIKTLISHIMETGFRHDNVGQPIPRDIITSFVCTYNGEEIFEAALYQAIAANPFITFHTVATESGTLRVPVDRRQRLHAGRLRENHGRMRSRARLALAVAARPARGRSAALAGCGNSP